MSSARDIFTLFDKQSTGSVPVSQLGDLLRATGHNPTQAQVSELAGTLGSSVTFEEFQAIPKDSLHNTGSLEEYIKAFQVFDKDGSGFVTVGDLKYMLCSLGERLSESEVEELLKGVTVLDGGRIDYRSFIEDILRQ